MSDTIGSATPSVIEKVYRHFSLKYPEVEFGLHLHTHPKFWRDKIDASFDSGCNRIDGAIQGFGGCPMASDELIGGYDIVKGERIKIKGALEDFALSKKEADSLIMSARDKVYKD